VARRVRMPVFSAIGAAPGGRKTLGRRSPRGFMRWPSSRCSAIASSRRLHPQPLHRFDIRTHDVHLVRRTLRLGLVLPQFRDGGHDLGQTLWRHEIGVGRTDSCDRPAYRVYQASQPGHRLHYQLAAASAPVSNPSDGLSPSIQSAGISSRHRTPCSAKARSTVPPSS